MNFTSFSLKASISKPKMQSTQYYNALDICTISAFKISRIGKKKKGDKMHNSTIRIFGSTSCILQFIEYSKNYVGLGKNDYPLCLY
jgi:hypothetical protein